MNKPADSHVHVRIGSETHWMAAVFWECVGNTKPHKGWPASRAGLSFSLVSAPVAVLVPVLLTDETSEETR